MPSLSAIGAIAAATAARCRLTGPGGPPQVQGLRVTPTLSVVPQMTRAHA